MKTRHLLPCAAAALLAVGCASSGKPKVSSGGTDNWYAVAAIQTPFYRYGPQQGYGPDMQLPHDSIMQVIQPSFGYVKVKLQDGESGYVASEDIRPAPPTLVAEKLAPPPDLTTPIVASHSEEGEQFGLDSNDPRLIAPPEPLPEMTPATDFRYEPAPLPDN
ncbi:MAG: hypothetical protein H0V54_10420 [Chthoniobacterales bacterium]|nr:hypothetical protein [Chthoniobacterales bacterium]